jgi:DNA-directed RNA polymerase specialized sigma24 family protein
MSNEPIEPDRSRIAASATTHWSLVVRAAHPDAPGAREALAELCRTWWYPVYAFIRRRCGAESAQDLTQGFFADLLARNALAAADASRGRFRTFLLACCTNYLANQRDADRALKRGGGRPVLSLDFASADDRYRHDLVGEATPEALYRRRWALTLLEATFNLLEQEYERAGRGRLYRLLQPSLAGRPDALAYAAVAEELEMTESAVKKAAQRLRQRYGELLRRQIAATVDGDEQIEDEIRELFAALES